MVFIETVAFTRYLKDYLNDDEYKEFQSYLMTMPEAGDLIQGTGGLRKIRWSSGGKGKRGGMRIIYYCQAAEDQIYLLTLYKKNEITNLSATDKRILQQMIARW